MANNLPEHFYLAPSSASRWLQCPGSLRASANIEDKAGEAAALGSLGHYLIEIDLTNKPLEEPQRQFLESLDGDVRKQLEEHVDLCVEIVRSYGYPESRYEVKLQSDLLEEHGGTIDVLAYDPTVGALHIMDFKLGRIKVDAEDNAQLKCYLVLARQLYPDAKRFLATIIQPRISHQPLTHEYTLEELEQHEADVLEASISDHFKAGDHCLYCPALMLCDTAAKHLRDQVQDFPDLTLLSKDNYTDEAVEQVARMYKTAKLAEKATESAGNMLKEWARKGAKVQDHGVGLRQGQRIAWKEGAGETVKRMISEGSFNDVFKTTLKTPNQTRAALDMSKEEFEDIFSDALDEVSTTTLVLGKDSKDFPEFPDE